MKTIKLPKSAKKWVMRMNYESELNFFCDVLEKCHIHTSMLSVVDAIGATVDSRFQSIVGYFSKFDVSVQQIIGNVENGTKYLLRNEFNLRYVCIRIPILSEKNILFIGPYLSAPMSSKDFLEICERMSIAPTAQKVLREYYATLPIIASNDRIFSMLDAFCERIWQTSSFEIVEFNKNYSLPIFPSDTIPRGESVDEILASAEMMEHRYAFENEIIRAVSLGQRHKETMLASDFNEQMFEKRVADPVRNAKNYCIIMNTLLRKAAEQGGVHPIHIDKLSSKFAGRIELANDTKGISELMKEMFSSYCRLVNKHSTGKYSPIVKKTIMLIDTDISAELSLATLARAQGISGGYLATVFKKETGKTVSEYIRDRRIEHAKYLLNTTHLQVQTVALHCGIMDVQYFSKIFKKQIGKTPKEYREDARR